MRRVFFRGSHLRGLRRSGLPEEIGVTLRERSLGLGSSYCFLIGVKGRTPLGQRQKSRPPCIFGRFELGRAAGSYLVELFVEPLNLFWSRTHPGGC